MRYGFLNPDDAVAGLLHIFNQGLALVGKFDSIRSTGAEHHLGALVDLRNRLDQLADAFLARDAAHEQYIRTLRVDSPLFEDFFVESRSIKVRIDTVVNHLHAIFGDSVKLHHVAFHAFTHGNHAVGSFVSGAFDPATHGVTAVTQLLRLPRTVRFQRMRRENQRALQKTASEHAAKVAVPRMAMDHVDILERGRPLEVDIERLENFLEAVVFGVEPELARKTERVDVIFVHVLNSKAARLDVAKLCKFLRQELHVDTGTAINFRREFVRQNCSVHNSSRLGVKSGLFSSIIIKKAKRMARHS